MKVPTRNCTFIKCNYRNCHEKKVSHRVAESKKWQEMHEKLHKYRCEPCLLIFKTQRESEDHQKRAHRVKCRAPGCKKYFLKPKDDCQHTLESSMKVHFEAKHKNLDYRNFL